MQCKFLQVSRSDKWKESKRLDLSNNDLWLKFISDSNETKRLLSPLDNWVGDLQVPDESFGLLYRLGQKIDWYQRLKVEYYAPYLLKEGCVQKVQYFDEDINEENPKLPPVKRVVEKFRFRQDKMNVRESFPDENRVVERFEPGRPDCLKSHEYFRLSSNHPTKYISHFYSEARFDGLYQRIYQDLELTDYYENRLDGLASLKAVFMLGEKKFGPADSTKSFKEIAKIIERFEPPSERSQQDGTGCETDEFNPGRILNTNSIMEKTFDIDNDRILIKFCREGGQLFCKTVEFLTPTKNLQVSAAGAGSDQKKIRIGHNDVKLYMVDPREECPCLRELGLIFEEQLKEQEQSMQRVDMIEKEMGQLLEDRMKQLSANAMEIWLYDVKRNIKVRRGRLDQEQARKDEEKSIMDLDIDILAPYLERYSDVESLTKSQAMAIRDECLTNVKAELRDKEEEIEDQLKSKQEELESQKGLLSTEDLNSKKFLINVLETRLERQQRYSKQFYSNAEKKVSGDSRLLKFIK